MNDPDSAAHDGSSGGQSLGHGTSSTSSRMMAADSIIDLVGFVAELVDDLHAWQICSQITIAMAHLKTLAKTLEGGVAVIRRVHDELDHFGVDHATIELCQDYADRDAYRNTHCH